MVKGLEGVIKLGRMGKKGLRKSVGRKEENRGGERGGNRKVNKNDEDEDQEGKKEGLR